MKFSLQAHEEQEEDGDVVYLLAGPLEYLVDPCLGHGELEGGADEANHDERPGEKSGKLILFFKYSVRTREFVYLGALNMDSGEYSLTAPASSIVCSRTERRMKKSMVASNWHQRSRR